VAWPVVVRAQQPAKLPTIGFMASATASTEGDRVAAFAQRLRELGWIDGRNVAIEHRWSEGRNERYAEIAAEFVRLKVEVIVTQGTAAVLAAMHATSVIPIVLLARATRLPAALLRVWRDQAATLPAFQISRLILPASESNYYARSYPVFAGWPC
jgi:putative ABC transport system substrate-binding protein